MNRLVFSLIFAGAAMVAFCEISLAKRYNATFKDCAIGCPEMIVLGAGSFQMGAPIEEGIDPNSIGLYDDGSKHTVPVHIVFLPRDFAMSKYDVTRKEYRDFVQETGYKSGGVCSSVPGKTRTKEEVGYDWHNPGFPQTDSDPVVCVSWGDAQAYVKWLSHKTGYMYRLPSEAEWEYAARAGTSTVYYWGNQWNDACRYANVGDSSFKHALNYQSIPSPYSCNDGFGFTSPVGSFPPNGFGLYDMLGNVALWTEDCWNENYRGAPSNGKAWLTGDCAVRVTRGGSWTSNHWNIRVAYRKAHTISPSVSVYRSSDVGFRVVRQL